ncbi:universal stress protein [Actinokineospora sp. NPDC004072]
MDTAPTGVIVVGADGSDLSFAALEWAITEGRRRGCRVLAVTVRPRGAAAAGAIAAEFTAAAARHPDVPVEHRVLTGTIGDALLAAADGAAMLVLGSHGANAVLSALLGSVAAYCVRHARVPVVLIPDALAPAPTTAEATALTPGPLF